MDNTRLKKYLNLSFLKTLREGLNAGEEDSGEGKFGVIPDTLDPDRTLNPLADQIGKFVLQPHPLLSKSAQFSGIDRHLTADPIDNTEAQQNYPQKRLEQQLQKSLSYRRRYTPPRLLRK